MSKPNDDQQPEQIQVPEGTVLKSRLVEAEQLISMLRERCTMLNIQTEMLQSKLDEEVRRADSAEAVLAELEAKQSEDK